MRFNYKIQQYQTDAVDAVVKVFSGQGYYDRLIYSRDLGTLPQQNQQYSFDDIDEDFDTGYKNEAVELSDAKLLQNIRKIQQQNNIKESGALVNDLGRCSLDIEMETGTGKTYVYIKTMFELNKRYRHDKDTENNSLCLPDTFPLRTGTGIECIIDIQSKHFRGMIRLPACESQILIEQFETVGQREKHADRNGGH